MDNVILKVGDGPYQLAIEGEVVYASYDQQEVVDEMVNRGFTLECTLGD